MLRYKYSSRYGRRRNYLRTIALSIPILLVLLFAYSALFQNGKFDFAEKLYATIGLKSKPTFQFPDDYLSNDNGIYHGPYPNSLLTLFYPYTMLRDVVLDQPVSQSDIPFFWHVHNTDERIVKSILQSCYNLELVELNDVQSVHRASRVNLIEGLDPKKHVVTSPFIREVSAIFTTEHFGRMLCFFRHPIDYDLHPSLPTFPRDDNWLVRLLADYPTKDITFKELGVAKHVVRQTCVVGTLDKMKRSIVRMGEYYGWKLSNEQCLDERLVDLPVDTWPDHESLEWKELYAKNLYDGQLYEIAQSAWRAQIQTIIPFEIQLQRAGIGEEEEEEKEEEEDER